MLELLGKIRSLYIGIANFNTVGNTKLIVESQTTGRQSTEPRDGEREKEGDGDRKGRERGSVMIKPLEKISESHLWTFVLTFLT